MIKYITGDLFDLLPVTNNKIFIPHIVNNAYKWGSGFVVPLGNHYPSVKKAYLDSPNLVLGETQFVKVEPAEDRGIMWVCNMVAQNGIIGPHNPRPIKYKALVNCMEQVANSVQKMHRLAEIHTVKFGSDRAGGNWSLIEELIKEIWSDIPTTIYQLQ